MEAGTIRTYQRIRWIALSALVVFSVGGGFLDRWLGEAPMSQLDLLLIRLGSGLLITASIAGWCWFDSKVHRTAFPTWAFVVMALCGFWTISRYFFLRDGVRRWLYTCFGLWHFAIAWACWYGGYVLPRFWAD